MRTFVVSAVVCGCLYGALRFAGVDWPWWIVVVAVASTVFQAWAAGLRRRSTTGPSLPGSETNRDNLGT